jgi:hypothetical protein
MLSLLFASLVCFGGFEAGGRVGVLFPGSGLRNSHGSAALFGVNLAYASGPSRFTLNYGYSGLSSRQTTSPYRFDTHELSLGYDHEFFRRSGASPESNWGFDAGAAAGYSLLRRALASASETGRTPAGHVAIGFFQRQGRSRLSLGLDNILFIEASASGGTSRVALTYLAALKGGVAYVF